MQKAGPFLTYFQETSRVAKVELVTRKQEYVQNKIRDFLKEHGFAHAKGRIQVVLFVFGEFFIIYVVAIQLANLFYRNK